MSSSKKVITKELEGKIVEVLKHLPRQCRTIFQMSRFENLKYREIASQLGLSIKTVENQMGKALKIMRTHLAEYLPVVAAVFSFIFHKIYK
jgi:RNA polymerase sigma-70 factor (ECF subfamily)